MDARQLGNQPFSHKGAYLLVPAKRLQVEKVHPRAVAYVDRSILSGEDGSQERAQKVDARRTRVRFRLLARKLHHLRRDKALDRG